MFIHIIYKYYIEWVTISFSKHCFIQGNYFFLSFPLPAHPHKLLQQKQAQEAMKAKAAELQAYQTYLEAGKKSRCLLGDVWDREVCDAPVMVWYVAVFCLILNLMVMCIYTLED